MQPLSTNCLSRATCQVPNPSDGFCRGLARGPPRRPNMPQSPNHLVHLLPLYSSSLTPVQSVSRCCLSPAANCALRIQIWDASLFPGDSNGGRKEVGRRECTGARQISPFQVCLDFEIGSLRSALSLKRTPHASKSLRRTWILPNIY